MDVARGHAVVAVVFGDQRVTVVEKTRHLVARTDLEQPPDRVIGQRRRSGADEAVLAIVDVAAGAVGGEISVGIVGKGCGARGRCVRGILVEAVGDIIAVDVDEAIIGVRVVVAAFLRDLRSRIVAQPDSDVSGRADKAVRLADQPIGAIIAPGDAAARALGCSPEQRSIVVGKLVE